MWINLSKPPPEVSRTILLRSYKYFEDKQFLSDIAELDWLDVLACPDLDVATEKINLNLSLTCMHHGNFINLGFLNRLSNVQLMNERDKLKKEAIALSN